MNPSHASGECSDDTVNAVIDYVYTNFPQVGKIIIHNIIPFADPNSKNLDDIFEKALRHNVLESSMLLNEKDMSEMLKDCHYLLLGYGEPSVKGYDEVYELAKTMLFDSIKSAKKDDLIYAFDIIYPNGKILEGLMGSNPRHPSPRFGGKPYKHFKIELSDLV